MWPLFGLLTVPEEQTPILQIIGPIGNMITQAQSTIDIMLQETRVVRLPYQQGRLAPQVALLAAATAVAQYPSRGRQSIVRARSSMCIRATGAVDAPGITQEVEQAVEHQHFRHG